ncbi:ArsR/SmtB family transcription factor [Ornithinimicrobium sp. W1665]|uniref:ArsR/SmtB family transcription factor n=1 Tax=Ornithinimicrobium sp. W1665 TaxID=3416666 RepID=UPI003D6C1286
MDEKKHDLFDRLAVVGKAFGNAKRLELVDLLSQGERTVEALAREAGLGMSTASAHLQVLKLSSLVRTRRDGPRVHYSPGRRRRARPLRLAAGGGPGTLGRRRPGPVRLPGRRRAG